jgi:hypothetical protein
MKEALSSEKNDSSVTPSSGVGHADPRLDPSASPRPSLSHDITPASLEEGLPARRPQGQPHTKSQANFHARGARPLFDRDLLKPSRRIKDGNLTWRVCIRNVVTYSWLNLLLVFVSAAFYPWTRPMLSGGTRCCGVELRRH